MLGHTTIKTTQIYSKVIDTKISKEMDDLSRVLESNNKVEEPDSENETKTIAI